MPFMVVKTLYNSIMALELDPLDRLILEVIICRILMSTLSVGALRLSD